MQTQATHCPRCGSMNDIINGRFCYVCGSPLRKTSNRWAIILILFAGVSFVGMVALFVIVNAINEKKRPNQIDVKAVWVSPTPTQNVIANEKQSRTAPAREMPAYAQVSNVASKLGFQLGAFKGDGDSAFMAEAKRFVGGREFRFVVMGPTRDRVDTVRIQAWGIQTEQSRRQLERWATQVLSSLNRGKLPRDFIQQLYAGSNVGDDGVSNGFCNVQVLQSPISPGIPNSNDRITIDLIFDKTD